MANILQNLGFEVSNIEVPPSKRVISAQPYQPEYDPTGSPVPVLVRFPFPVFHLKLAQLRRQVHQCNSNHLVIVWMEYQYQQILSINILPESKYSNIKALPVVLAQYQVESIYSSHALRTTSCFNLWFPLKTKGGTKTVIHKCPRHLNLDFI